MNATQVWFDVLRRRWRILLTMPALALLAALGVTLTLKPTYQATATIALAPTTLSIPTSNQLPPYYLMVDSPRHLPPAYTPTYYLALLKDASLAPNTPRVTFSLGVNANDRALIEITARGEDATQVAEAANAYARAGVPAIEKLLAPSDHAVTTAQKNLDAAELALVKFARDNNLGEYALTKMQSVSGLSTDKQLQLERLLRAREIAENVYLDFAREHERATILAGNAYAPRVIAASVLISPVAPNWVQNMLAGAAFGLLVGIVAAFALETVQR